MSEYLSCEHYLPHRPPMVLIDKIEDVGDDYAVLLCEVNDSSVLAPFITDKGLPGFIILELFSQAVGIWSGYHSIKNDGDIPPLGMVLGGREIYCKDRYFPYGSTLKIKVTRIMDDGKLASFDGELTCSNGTDAKGRVNVIRVSDDEINILFKRD
ncbi:MAG: hypothetical protein ACI4M9_00500 [Succinivibrio sp.]